MLANLLAGTDRTRWHSSVVALRRRGALAERIESLGVSISSLGVDGSVPSPASTWRLVRAVRTLAPELIQGWMYHGNLAALVGRAFGVGRPVVVWNIRSNVFPFSIENRLTTGVVRLCGLISSRVDAIIYNSRASAAKHAELGFATKGSVVIPNGFDTRAFAPSPVMRAGLRARLGLSDDAVLVGRLGRYHQVKDFPGFLEAAAIVAARRPNVVFALAGPGVDQRNAELMSLIERFGIGRTVHLLGEVRPAYEFVAALDILCSSSAYGESFPNVLGEAMACEVPCVTTDLGDSAWVVGDSGRVVPPRNPGALAAGCEELVDLGIEGRQRLGREGRRRVQREFSLDSVVAQYERLYRALLVRRTRT